jgi:transposase-like protein
MSTTSSSPPSPKSNRHWSAAEKASLIRRHLRDGVPVATIADESGAAPSQAYAWIKQVLEGADQVLGGLREREDQRSEKALLQKDQRILQLEEVAAELSMEVLQLKKRSGAH